MCKLLHVLTQTAKGAFDQIHCRLGLRTMSRLNDRLTNTNCKRNKRGLFYVKFQWCVI